MSALWSSVSRFRSPLERFALALAVIVGVASGSQPGEAALIELDSSFGPTSVTRDTDTGLEWLDLRYTHGFIDETNERLAPGGDLFGWRRATTDEVVTFWDHAGIAVTGTGDSPALSSDPAYVAAVDALMNNLGLWQAHPSVDFTHGFTAEPGETPGTWYTAFLARYWDSDLEQFTQAAASIWTEREANPALPCCEPYQNWLVRDFTDMPEPAPFALLALGAGLAGFGIRRRRVA